MGSYYWGWHGGGMWVFPAIFLIAVIVMLFRSASCTAQGRGTVERESARDILDRRYASGEINQEQFEEMKRHLERS